MKYFLVGKKKADQDKPQNRAGEGGGTELRIHRNFQGELKRISHRLVYKFPLRPRISP